MKKRKSTTYAPKFSVRVAQALRRNFIAGLAALFPVAVTIYLLTALFRFLDNLLGRYLTVHIPGLGLILTVFILLLVGFLSTHFVGQVVFPTVELWFGRLPFIRQIYPSVKQLSQFLFGSGDESPAFQGVVWLEYPKTGLYSIGFVTHQEESALTGTREKLLTLLIPTTPSPFSGPIIFVSEEAVVYLDISVEDALKLVVSGGVVFSSLRPIRK